jgi:hypothetical protein
MAWPSSPNKIVLAWLAGVRKMAWPSLPNKIVLAWLAGASYSGVAWPGRLRYGVSDVLLN